MAEHRAKSADLCMADAMPFQQHHEYRTTLPIADVLSDRFFLDARANLRVGDAITICRFADRAWRQLTEIADVRVASIGDDGVRLHLRGEIEAIPVAEAPAVPIPEPLSPAERYAGPDWTATHRGFGRWAVLDATGREMAGNLDKETAVRVARGDLPLPGPV